jgi:NTE family protein
VAENINKCRTEVFSWETTPNVIISDAVRCSMSVPYIFKPHQLFIKDIQRNRLPDPSGDIYIDGGLTENYFIKAFDKARYVDPLSTNPDDPVVNDNTLGISLSKCELAEEDMGSLQKLNFSAERQSIFVFTYAILRILHEKQNHVYLSDPNNIRRTIIIDGLDISGIAFGVSRAKQLDLIASGKAGVMSYIEKREVSYKHFREYSNFNDPVNWNIMQDSDFFPAQKRLTE